MSDPSFNQVKDPVVLLSSFLKYWLVSGTDWECYLVSWIASITIKLK